MLAAQIALLRNGACVVKDLLHPEHPVLATKLPFNLLHYPDHVPAIDLFIAILQLAAVLFGVIGGLNQISAGLKKTKRALQFRSGLSELKDRASLRRELAEANTRLTRALMDGIGALLDGIVSFVTGVCFYYLYLGTLGWMEEEVIMWIVVIMEAVLAVALVKCAADLYTRWSRANLLRNVEANTIYQPSTVGLMLDYVESRPLAFAWDNDLVPYHIQALISDVNHLARAYETLQDVVKAKGPSASYNVQEVLRRAHKAADASLSQLWFDVGLATMDLIAFWGYFVIPLTYFYRDEEIYHNFLYGYYPGHKLVNYGGNLVGDVMWTVQPIVQLNGTAVLRYLERIPAATVKAGVAASKEVADRKRRSRKEKDL